MGARPSWPQRRLNHHRARRCRACFFRRSDSAKGHLLRIPQKFTEALSTWLRPGWSRSGNCMGTAQTSCSKIFTRLAGSSHYDDICNSRRKLCRKLCRIALRFVRLFDKVRDKVSDKVSGRGQNENCCRLAGRRSLSSSCLLWQGAFHRTFPGVMHIKL